MKINLGCGYNKISEFINIDMQGDCQPDLILDFINEDLPYMDDSCDEVVMFHTIEHIEKRHHQLLFSRIWRVLKMNGILILSYPEFSKCAGNWLQNFMDKRDFWEMTIYGRQLHEGDYHVSIINTPDLIQSLSQASFNSFDWASETKEEYNTILTCRKCNNPTYADWLRIENGRFEIKREIKR